MTPWPAIGRYRRPDRRPACPTAIAPAFLGSLGLFGCRRADADLWCSCPTAPSYANVAWRMLLVRPGIGFFQSPNNPPPLVGSAPPERSGAGSGMLD